mgnify:CR=1 FL=1
MRFALVVTLLFSALTAFAHVDPNGHDYAVSAPSASQMERLAAEFEVLRKTAGGFEFYVPHAKLARFRALAPRSSKLPVSAAKASDLAQYRNYESVSAELQELANQYPRLAKLETYGTTRSGHVLYALKISDNVTVDENEPELMLTSATHGDELVTVEVMMQLVRELLAGHGRDTRLSRLINERELWVLPMVNPQGYSRRTRYANGFTDPNRDYPYPDKPDVESVDCIDLLRKFFHAHDFKGSLDVHASGRMVMYPWAYTERAPEAADVVDFEHLVNSMAEQNGYAAGQISKVIYVAKGSSADYYYWKNRTKAIAVELTTSKVPPIARVPAVVDEAREMVWRFIENF